MWPLRFRHPLVGLLLVVVLQVRDVVRAELLLLTFGTDLDSVFRNALRN
jgi:hypothetical protein